MPSTKVFIAQSKKVQLPLLNPRSSPGAWNCYPHFIEEGARLKEVRPQAQDYKLSSVQFTHSVVSDSLWPHGLQHARSPCPSPTPRVYSKSCPSSQWCHPTISSSVVPFSCLQSFPTSGSFQMSQHFTSGGQNIGLSTSTSVFQWKPRTDLL